MASLYTARELFSRTLANVVSKEVPFAYRDDNGVLQNINNLSEINTIVSPGGASTITGSVETNQESIYYQQNFQNLLLTNG